jgi:hypothetical protein
LPIYNKITLTPLFQYSHAHNLAFHQNAIVRVVPTQREIFVGVMLEMRYEDEQIYTTESNIVCPLYAFYPKHAFVSDQNSGSPVPKYSVLTKHTLIIVSVERLHENIT